MTPLKRQRFPEIHLARRQHGVVHHAQLLAAGLTRDAIRHRLNSERLHPVHRGVYAVGRPVLSREGRWPAATFGCGPDALLSHWPAALLWELVERGDERPHVSVPTWTHRAGPVGVVLHRCPSLTAEDVAVRCGIPVTSLQRVLIDLAGMLDRRSLKGAVRQAERRHRIDLAGLRAAVEVPRRDPRKARLRAVLDAYVPGPVADGLEERFLELCQRERLPLPRCQVEMGPYRVDFLFAERLVVETDGAATHDTAVARVDDRAKDRYLRAAGYDVYRYTWRDVVHQPRLVATEIRAALRRLRRK
jgi:very-short-patch-repair endonuclease